MRNVLIILLIAFALPARAGQERVDSILHALPGVSGKVRADLLAGLTWELERLGRYDEALKYGKQSLQLSDSLDYKYGIAASHNHLGAVYKGLGEFTVALEHLQRAQKLFTELKNQRGLASTGLNMGNLYSSMGQHDKAMDKYLQALEYGKKARDSMIMAVCLGNVGTIFHLKSETAEAEIYYKESLQIREAIGDLQGAATMYNNLGIVYFDREEFNEAIKYYEMYLRIAIEENLVTDIITGNLNLGEAYTMTGRFEEGLELMEKGLREALRTGARELEKSAYETFFNAWLRKGDAEKSLHYAELLRAVKDTILNASNARAIAEMETRFETEKKENEIALLSSENRIRELESEMKESELTWKTYFTWSSWAAIVLLTGILLFTLYNVQVKKKANYILSGLNAELELQATILEQKNLMINDSIDYARTIQETLFHDEKEIAAAFPGFFMRFGTPGGIGNFVYALEQFPNARVFVLIHSHFDGVSGSLHALRIFHALKKLCRDGFEPGIVVHFLQSLSKRDFSLCTAFRTEHNKTLHVVAHSDIVQMNGSSPKSDAAGITAVSATADKKVRILSSPPHAAEVVNKLLASMLEKDGKEEVERLKGRNYVALRLS